MSRRVTLVLVDRSGAVLGALPPYEVPMPWWQEVADVVDGARQHYGVDVTVLRLLRASRDAPNGGEVVYLAELSGAGTPSMVGVDARDQPGADERRAPWAEPGGPAATLGWAAERLAERGRLVVRPVQQRAWNLSAIWRLDTVSAGGPAPADMPERVDIAREPVWVKQVPQFFAHEAAVLRWLGDTLPGTAPELLAAGPHGRLLLAHVPGDGRYAADTAERDALAGDLHRVQLRSVPDLDQLIAVGLPDLRAPWLADRIRAVIAAHAPDDPALTALADGLDARLAAVAECGLPDTLVHGDLHPGNAIGARDARMIIDWGDSFAGHPAFDILRLADGDASLIGSWAARWRSSVPGCDPEHAIALLRPVAALRHAAVYAGFLDRIERSEHRFHAADVPYWLDAARALL
ncbi:phosphotransferase family protein [Catenuloplanes sp. NPDC051500]|uniref:phosphotransferase family protein n=1 Tax=Catenuloplanes sp. NPDC051500 TaxID=3363959 RepID=UPI0037B22062